MTSYGPSAVIGTTETMAEAALALCTAEAAALTGRIAFSLQLQVELKRPVLDLHGEHPVEGWQPQDLPEIIARQEQSVASRGWPNAYTREITGW